MANVAESAVWEGGIYQLEETDDVQGGENGIDNLQAKQLGNRTTWLKGVIDEVITAAGLTPDSGEINQLLLAIQNGVGLSNDLSADNGYQVLPGGLILQWAKIQTTPTEQFFTYPIAFPNMAFFVGISSAGQVDGIGETQQAELHNLANFKAANSSEASRNARVIALGK